MKFYNNNLELFKKYNTTLYQTIVDEPTIYELKITSLKDGNYIVENSNAKCFLNSIYNVNREYDKVLDNLDTDAEIVTLFGLTNKLLFKKIIAKCSKLKILIIIEPFKQLFINAMNTFDFMEIFKNLHTVSFFINKSPEDVSNLITNIRLHNMNLKYYDVFSLQHRALLYGYFEQMQNTQSKSIIRTMSNICTSDHLKRIWTYNFFKNINFEHENLGKFIDKFKGLTAIMVSAGPSLNKNINLLNEVKNRALIFSVGTASKILDSHGIKPHFRCAFDAWLESSYIFESIDTSCSTLIYSDRINYKILENYKGKKLKMVLKNDFFSKYVYDRANIEYFETEDGHSISNAMLNILIKLGFKKLILLGQDLGSKDGKMYANGSRRDEYNLQTNHSGIKIKKDVYGEDIYTSSSFLAIKNAFEDVLKNNPDLEVINSSEGGIIIENTKFIPFNESLKDISEEDIERISLLLDELNSADNKNVIGEIFSNTIIHDIEKDIEYIIDICEKGRAKLINFNINNNNLNENTKSFWMEIENIENELKSNKFYNQVVLSILSSTLECIIFSNKSKTDISIDEINKTMWNRIFEEILAYVGFVKNLIIEHKTGEKIVTFVEDT